MSQRVRTDFVAGLQPGFNRLLVHQLPWNLTGRSLPLTSLPKKFGHEELNGFEMISLKQRQSIFKDVLVTIIEADKNPSGVRFGSLSQFTVGGSNEAFPLQLPDLLFEQFRTDVKTLESGALGAGSNVM